VLGPENLAYSADLAGRIRAKSARWLGGLAVYLNSCAGNISTHYTRQARTIGEMERLAEKFLAQLPSSPGQEVNFRPLKWWTTEVRLPLAQRQGVTPMDERALPGIRLASQRWRLDDFRTAPLALVQLGDVAFLFLPFEIFYETGQRLMEVMRLSFKWPLIVGYAMAYRPYVVPRGREGTYEWFASTYAEEAEEVLTKEVTKLVRSVARNDSTR
jgi:hypothetical protein